MAQYGNNTQLFNPQEIPDGSGIKVGIAYAQWNSEVTDKLLQGALEVLEQAGLAKENIFRISVPGSYELTAGAQWLYQHHPVDVVICLGCVIQGETRHFDFICHAVATGLNGVTLKFGKPVIFGVLTTDNQQQALERCGGAHGHKGREAALTALQMALLSDDQKNKIGF
ncbi:MAG: 6,7-dimethyl-8-ribityllumazine synthase [Bacteroidetes bacterium]|nr:6,7-dimethyl-8-ribityllumazine synthase [Bacteroidota bacterium]